MSTKKSKSKSQDKNKSSQSKKSLSFSQQIQDLGDFEDHILDIDIKKNRTARQIFISETMQTEYPNQRVVDVISKISKQWEALNEKKKEKFEELATKEKERYEENMGLVRKHLIAKPPKESTNAYLLFMDERVKAAIENMDDIKEARAKARAEWNNLSNNAKKEWEDKVSQNKDLYERLKNIKPGKVSAYALWVKDQCAASREKGKTMTLTECAEKWPKVKEETKEKYAEYARELQEEKEKQRDLYEITFGIKPRRPLGPYNYFLQEMAKNKKFSGSNFFKECSKAWKKMTDEEKENYKKIAKRGSLIYQVKKMEFNNFKRSTYKKAPSAFNLYISDMSEKLTEKDLNGKTVFEVLSAKWNKESDAIKRKYQKKAEEGKKENEQERDDYMNRVYDPPKRARSGYQIYLSERVPELKEKHPNKPTADLFKMIADEWNGMKEDKKEKYNKKAEPGREEYKMKMKEYDRLGYYVMDEKERAEKSAKKEARSQKSKSPMKTKSKKKKD